MNTWSKASPHHRAAGHVTTRVFFCFVIPLYTLGGANATYLHFGGDEETGDADELQRWLEDVPLRGHEAVEVVLGEVVWLPVQLVHLAHLKTGTQNGMSTQARCLEPRSQNGIGKVSLTMNSLRSLRVRRSVTATRTDINIPANYHLSHFIFCSIEPRRAYDRGNSKFWMQCVRCRAVKYLEMSTIAAACCFSTHIVTLYTLKCLELSEFPPHRHIRYCWVLCDWKLSEPNAADVLVIVSTSISPWQLVLLMWN